MSKFKSSKGNFLSIYEENPKLLSQENKLIEVVFIFKESILNDEIETITVNLEHIVNVSIHQTKDKSKEKKSSSKEKIKTLEKAISQRIKIDNTLKQEIKHISIYTSKINN